MALRERFSRVHVLVSVYTKGATNDFDTIKTKRTRTEFPLGTYQTEVLVYLYFCDSGPDSQE